VNDGIDNIVVSYLGSELGQLLRGLMWQKFENVSNKQDVTNSVYCSF